MAEFMEREYVEDRAGGHWPDDIKDDSVLSSTVCQNCLGCTRQDILENYGFTDSGFALRNLEELAQSSSIKLVID